MNSKSILFIAGLVSSSLLLASTISWAGDNKGKDLKTFEVKITNLTPGQPMAPFMVATHRAGMSYFESGEVPTPGLDYLAEAGNGHPIAEMLLSNSKVSAVEFANAGTPPGHTATIIIRASEKDHLSMGAMLGNTNDAFVALADVDLPKDREMMTYMATAYDAGTETNNESCNSVPGPACGGEALSPEDSGEGFVAIHNGVHGIGGLNAATHTWQNPVAKVVIKQLK